MTKQSLWTHGEYLLSLSFYCLNPNPTNPKELNEFSKKMSKLTGIPRSFGSVSRRIGNYQNLDPHYTENGNVGLKNGGNSIRLYWKKYVTDDPTFEKLKVIYFQYEKGVFDLGNEKSLIDSSKLKDHLEKYFVKKSKYTLQDEETEQTFINETDALLSKKIAKSLPTLPQKDLPEPRPEPVTVRPGQTVYKRNSTVSALAIRKANYRCECDGLHESFIRRVDGNNYTEAHHLIPVSAQGNFTNNLDVQSNIVSLCSNCHNNLHYGKENKEILEKLFSDRKERLHTAGIDITFEELLDYYR